jgi:DNA integrity scanning protein DisA with diadenylate cyclase activity
MFESLLCQIPEYGPTVVEPLIELAVEIAREGREGRRIGTLFTLGDHEEVLSLSRPMILDPLQGHPESMRYVTDPNLRGTIKELAQLDGAFVITDSGLFVAACRYLGAPAAAGVDMPLGLGSRHLAAANMSAVTKAIGVVVSQSATVRVFCHGKLTAEIIPELWLMNRHNLQLQGQVTQENVGDIAIITPTRGGGQRIRPASLNQ